MPTGQLMLGLLAGIAALVGALLSGEGLGLAVLLYIGVGNAVVLASLAAGLARDGRPTSQGMARAPRHSRREPVPATGTRRAVNRSLVKRLSSCAPRARPATSGPPQKRGRRKDVDWSSGTWAGGRPARRGHLPDPGAAALDGAAPLLRRGVAGDPGRGPAGRPSRPAV